MSRLTRSEMKRDEVLETASRFYHYITDHTRALLVAALAFAGVVLAGVAIMAYLHGRSAKANLMVARALSAYSADIVTDGADPDNEANPTFATEEDRDQRAQELFRQVEEKYGGTSVGNIAGVYLGRIAARRGDTALAREHWEEFVASGDDTMLMTEVRVNLIALDRSEGREEEVVDRLRESIATEDSMLPREIALDELARTLEQLGREAEAREYYQQLVDEFPSSSFAERARQRLLEP